MPNLNIRLTRKQQLSSNLLYKQVLNLEPLSASLIYQLHLVDTPDVTLFLPRCCGDAFVRDVGNQIIPNWLR